MFVQAISHRNPMDEEEAAMRIQALYRGRKVRSHMRKRVKKLTISGPYGNEKVIHRAPKGSPSLVSGTRAPKGSPSMVSGTSSRHESLPSKHTSPSVIDLTNRGKALSGISVGDSAHIPTINSRNTDYASIRRDLEVQPTRLPRRVQLLRIYLYMLFDEPRSSCAAQVVSVLLLAMIIISIVCFMIETMPELKDVSKDTWLVIESCCTAVFTLEYTIRLLVCSVTGKTVCEFILSPMNLIDLFAILPFYLTVAMRSLQMAKALGVLRTVRLVRLFRIFKLGRYSSGLQLMAEALRNSSQALWVLSFFLCIGIVLFSSALYYVERMGCPDRNALESKPFGSNQTEWDEYVAACRSSNSGWHKQHGLCCDEHGSPLDFPSIPDTFWWSTVTMTTVGFGEVYPRTELGKIVAEVTMLSGILLIALPVAIIGRKFQEAYENHHYQAEAEDMSGEGECDGSQQLNKSATHASITSAKSMTRVTTNGSANVVRKESGPPRETGPSLAEISRRLRLMKLPDGNMTALAFDLADDFEEAGELQKEISSMQKNEREREKEVIDRFEVVLNRFCELRDRTDGDVKKVKSGFRFSARGPKFEHIVRKTLQGVDPSATPMPPIPPPSEAPAELARTLG